MNREVEKAMAWEAVEQIEGLTMGWRVGLEMMELEMMKVDGKKCPASRG